MNSLTKQPEWQILHQHQTHIASQHMREWFLQDPSRHTSFSVEAAGIHLDYSRNLMTKEALTTFATLLEKAQLTKKIGALFTGQFMNTSENRPVLHTALRDQTQEPIMVSGKNIVLDIQSTKEALATFVSAIHDGTWQGVTGKRIQHIVNLGIGGSYIGPKMTVEALKDFAICPLHFHFISSVDKAKIDDVLQLIDPETTLFIISSKTFTTIETLTNAETILHWMQQKLGKEAISKHFIAITADPNKAEKFGIPANHIFPFWDWVGGRYSIWSAIGLPLMLMIGTAQFNDFQTGAFAMDQHFREAPILANIPVLLALLQIWYVNFFHTHAQAIAPYSYRLRSLVPYLQQAEMESNGKQVNLTGQKLNNAACPILFGEEGCNGQHAYHQLLHQGLQMVPVDFILPNNNKHDAENSKHHAIMTASALSQARALLQGKSEEEAYQALLNAGYSANEAKQLAPHHMIPGNRPSNLIQLNALNPYHLGALLAMYEHKIFVAGVIWDINSFDQWGVQLGKQLLPDILHAIHPKQEMKR